MTRVAQERTDALTHLEARRLKLLGIAARSGLKIATYGVNEAQAAVVEELQRSANPNISVTSFARRGLGDEADRSVRSRLVIASLRMQDHAHSIPRSPSWTVDDSRHWHDVLRFSCVAYYLTAT